MRPDARLQRLVPRLAVLALACAQAHAGTPADALEPWKAHAGTWEAELPGFGLVEGEIRVVSNGTAIEETIGTAQDREVSLYTRDAARILLTHFCALTPGGHVVRLLSSDAKEGRVRTEFVYAGATNRPSPDAPHMRRVVTTWEGPDRFTETWTKTESGKDTVFELHFRRRAPSPGAAAPQN